MTLQKVRDAKDLEELKLAIQFLVENKEEMTYGVVMAYKRTIEEQAKKLNIDLSVINDLAAEYENKLE